jgi:hypothetical protein
MKKTSMASVVLLMLGLAALVAPAYADKLEDSFRNPPPQAAPWTYWFWINGNITKAGITADLEALAQSGIKGVLIMEVANPKSMAPNGPYPFGSPEWRELFKFAVAEAGRLGLEINMNNDAGWCGSGGPWNTPENSMQKVVASSTTVNGPGRFEGMLPRPKLVSAEPAKVAAAEGDPKGQPAAKTAKAKKKAKRPSASPAAPGNLSPAALAAQQYYADLKVLAYPVIAKGGAIAPDKLIDLSDKMDATGKLNWDAPAGEWTVMRIGHVSTGKENHPAPVAGMGLECDKFSAEAIKRHFEGLIGMLADDVGPAAGKVLTYTHIDSWEVGWQDWTPRMAEEFKKRRGYDMTPWLITLAGGPGLGDAERTARFLRDAKRTQSELLDENYAGALRKLANARGLKLSIEAYGPNSRGINPLTYGAEADLPMAEFWIMRWNAWHLNSARMVSSMVHELGKPFLGAESLTSSGENDPFTEHPYSVKNMTDWGLCQGVNRFIFHRTALNPWVDKWPGMTFGPYGFHVDRTQTWWKQGKAYMDYLARCQSLLQQGRFVADYCRLLPDGENYGGSPMMETLPAQYDTAPAGYNYDYISDKLTLESLSVKDGRLVLPSGMSYRVMQLPNYETMTPELLAKVRDLVKAGAVVVGPPPRRSPSLANYPACDQQVKEMAAELWGDCDGAAVQQHALGVGRVIWGRPLQQVLKDLARAEDFTFTLNQPYDPAAAIPPSFSTSHPAQAFGTEGKGPGPVEQKRMPTDGMNWLHRRIDGAEVYFVANAQYRPVEAQCAFRVTDRVPELWDPAAGTMRALPEYRQEGVCTLVPLSFDPAGSMFVVFRQAEKDRSNAQAGTPKGKNFPALKPVMELSGPWEVAFDPKWGGPEKTSFQKLEDWTRRSEEGIKFYSGTAVYRKSFEVEQSTFRAPHVAIYLNLGTVREIAEVTLNGKALGVLWKPPFQVDVRGALRPGANALEVRVTNLWPNRMIGDEQYPDDCTPDGSWRTGKIPAWPEWVLKGQPRPEPRRLTFSTTKYFTKDAPLIPSGMMGPVQLQAEVAE